MRMYPEVQLTSLHRRLKCYIFLAGVGFICAKAVMLTDMIELISCITQYILNLGTIWSSLHQFHIPAPLPSKSSQYWLDRRLDRPLSQPETCEEHNALYLLLVLKPKFSSRAAKNLVTVLWIPATHLTITKAVLPVSFRRLYYMAHWSVDYVMIIRADRKIKINNSPTWFTAK
jgi:hypothetical protein